MANWLPMALTGAPRAWLLNFPGSSVTSWEELRNLFVACFASPAPHTMAALLDGPQALPSDHHIKQFFRLVGAPRVQQGSPPGWVAPKANLTLDSGDHPVTTAGAGALLMLCTPSSATLWSPTPSLTVEPASMCSLWRHLSCFMCPMAGSAPPSPSLE